MGILEFFGFGKKEEKPAEKLRFEDLESWLENRKREDREKEKAVIKLVDGLIKNLAAKLEEQLEILKKIDLKERKVEEKIKLVVIENLANYSNYMSRLIGKLENIKEESIEKLKMSIDKTFSEFGQKSAMSYEKATFLIGKELGDTKESISGFFSELKNILEENKELIHELRVIDFGEARINEIKQSEKLKSDIADNMRKIDEHIKSFEEKTKIIQGNIDNIKNSREYIEESEEKKKARLKLDEIEKETIGLREMADLKSLAKVFHGNEKKMAIINSYMNNFSLIFEDDKILGLIDEAGRDTTGIKNKISKIIQEREQAGRILSKKDKAEELALDITKISTEINNMNSEKLKEEKRISKIDENIASIRDAIKKEFLLINVEIV